MYRPLIAALCAATIALAPVAHASPRPTDATDAVPANASAGWSAILDANLRTRLEVKGKRVLVLSGADDTAHKTVSQSIRTALAGTDGAAVLLDDSAAPHAVGLADSDALTATATLPVDLRILVRVVGPAGSQTAVLSVYDAAGELVTATTVQQSTAGRPGAAAGVKAVQKATKERATGLGSAIEEYERRYIWIEHLTLAYRNGSTRDRYYYYRGKHRRRMRMGAVIDAVADDSIRAHIQKKREAQKETSNQQLLLGLAAPAGGLIAAGGIWRGLYLRQLSGSANPYPRNSAAHEQYATFHEQQSYLAFGVAALGGVTTLVGLGSLAAAAITNASRPGRSLSSAGIDQPQLHELIEAHNAALAKELGLEGVSGLPTGLERL